MLGLHHCFKPAYIVGVSDNEFDGVHVVAVCGRNVSCGATGKRILSKLLTRLNVKSNQSIKMICISAIHNSIRRHHWRRGFWNKQWGRRCICHAYSD